jgi:peptide/nickel transport system substrate-binding protein
VQRLQNTPGFTARTFFVNGYDDLVINSYSPPPGGRSLGNPVLRDWRFRQALQWAVDREKLVAIALHSLGQPGDTAIVAGYSTDPDWHWTPPASQAYTFDLEQAGRALDDAGYRDTNDDGTRDYRGAPIELRLWAMSEYPTAQTEVKLIASCLRQIGLKIDVETMPMAAAYDRIYNTDDGALVPDFDLCQSGWYLGLDPGQNLSWFTTGQIGGWNDSAFSNRELDHLFVEQGRTLNVVRRKQLIDRMQQIVYDQSPYIVLDYFGDTEAWSNKWVGWVMSPAGIGSAVVSFAPIDSYLLVRPQTGEAAAGEGLRGTVWLAFAGIAVVIVVGVVLRRRRRAPMEE